MKPTDELDEILNWYATFDETHHTLESWAKHQAHAKAAIQALVNKARIDEHQNTADMFVYENAAITYKRLEKRLAELKATQGENSESS